MSPFAQILVAGIGTYLLRASAILLAGRLASPSASVEQTLRLIAPAVLAAIVADRLFLVDGQLTAQWDWWLAGLIAGAVAWRWRSAGITMAVGMLAVWLLSAIS